MLFGWEITEHIDVVASLPPKQSEAPQTQPLHAIEPIEPSVGALFLY